MAVVIVVDRITRTVLGGLISFLVHTTLSGGFGVLVSFRCC
jgi:hypothetical protein